jgi:hypothetical protein
LLPPVSVVAEPRAGARGFVGAAEAALLSVWTGAVGGAAAAALRSIEARAAEAEAAAVAAGGGVGRAAVVSAAARSREEEVRKARLLAALAMLDAYAAAGFEHSEARAAAAACGRGGGGGGGGGERQLVTMKSIFRLFDADDSGELSAAELRELCTCLRAPGGGGGGGGDGHAQALMAALDEDGSGGVDLNEFMHGVQVRAQEHGLRRWLHASRASLCSLQLLSY